MHKEAIGESPVIAENEAFPLVLNNDNENGAKKSDQKSIEAKKDTDSLSN